MQSRAAFKLLSTFLTFSCLLNQGLGANCAGNSPTVNQTEVGFGEPPKFMVDVQNKCPMCPIINVHLNCGSFPQRLVSPRLLKVIGFDDCVLNAGLPLAPLQTFSFNYSHHMFVMHPTNWSFQCE
ncbi:hypothetical protein I3843_02G047500 [Carya illinoinensis]|nr:hypothetical protein I3843_02G047500 [Carya illinoinensis]